MKESSGYFVHMPSAPAGSPHRPSAAPSPGVRGRHRAGRGRRLLWTSGLVAGLVGAGLVAPSLVAPEASSSVAHPAIEQARKARQAPAPATSSAPTTPAPTTVAPPASSTTAPAPGPAGTTAPTSTAPAAGTPSATGTTSATGSSAPSTPAAAPVAVGDNPLAGLTFHGPNTGAIQAAAQGGRSAEDTAALTELASAPTATWLGGWSGDVTAAARRAVADADAAGAVAVLVVYNIPGRDCGGHSAGGADSSAAYRQWVQGVAAGIGSGTAVVVLEPDALAHLCGDPTERLALLRSAVTTLEQNPGTHTYVDAGHPHWLDAATAADRLRAVGAAEAGGFALNVSNFVTTADNVAYGQQVSALLGGAHFVVDTSRNGNGPGSDWCNPSGRALGERPTARTGQSRVDAFLYVKRPGESDGACNGGPAAGTFWPTYAIGLVRAAA